MIRVVTTTMAIAIFYLAINSLVFAQAPQISYQTPQNYKLNGLSIDVLLPANQGGYVPETIYGDVSTFAGSGAAGSQNSPAEASFNSPYGIAIDGNGNIYIADQLNNLIRKITASGSVSTLAGSGSAGLVDGKGTAASFYFPEGVAVDADGTVYVADVAYCLIRKITAAGEVTTFAGNGAPGSADGKGNGASFSGPKAIAIDATGNLYVADRDNNLIRKITPDGTVTTLAGSGLATFNDGIGKSASFDKPSGIAVDKNNNVYVVDVGNQRIRKITPAGVVTTIAGNGNIGFSNGESKSSSFRYPIGLCLDPKGNIYVADRDNGAIRMINTAGYVSTIAGNGQLGFRNGTASNAQFNDPLGVVWREGNAYVADQGDYVIRKIVLTGYTIDKPLPEGLAFDGNTGAISGIPSVASPATDYTITAYNKDGSSRTVVSIAITADAAPLPQPQQIAPLISYQMPQSYLVNNIITPLVPKNDGGAVPANAYGQVSTFAGTGAFGNDIGEARTATFEIPQGLAFDKDNVMYVADYQNNIIKKISPAGIVSILAGSGQVGSKDGQGAAATFRFPAGIAVDKDGNVYVSDIFSNIIRKITPGGNVVTIAGSLQPGLTNGTGTSARFKGPLGLAVDKEGNLFVADRDNALIRKITPEGLVSTYAGTGVAGSANGYRTSATFAIPYYITFDNTGNLYVSDNNSIRKISPDGMVSTLAGSDLAGANDGLGSAAGFNSPMGLAADRLGNIYVADWGNFLLRKITPYGLVSTLAGNGTQSFKNGIGTQAGLSGIEGLAIDDFGSLYAADIYFNNVIRKIQATGYGIDKPLPAGLTFDPTTGIINGTPTVSSPATDYTITAYNNYGSSSAIVQIEVKGNAIPKPQPVAPPVISYDTPKNYAINTPIASLTPRNTGGDVPANAYGEVSTFAGGRGPVSYDGTGNNAGFSYPSGVGTDNAGDFYVSDYGSGAIRKITADGTVITINNISQPSGLTVDVQGNIFVSSFQDNVVYMITPAGVKTAFAGNGVAGANDGAPNTANFNSPGGLTSDATGNIYVADQQNNSIRKISPLGIVATLPGANTFNNPDGVAIDNAGNLFVADTKHNIVQKIAANGTVTVFAGSGQAGSADGTGIGASFNYPTNITIDAAGNLYVADYLNNLIRKITPAGIVTTLAGNVIAGNANGSARSASFNGPLSLVFDNSGYLFVTDFNNYLIREIALTGYSIDKPLPAGLIFNPQTGVISGTPTVLSPATDYTITAYNAGGQSSAIINVAISDVLTKQTSLITFPQLPLLIDQNNDITPAATSNNKETPVTYTSSDPSIAIITAEGLIHILKVGHVRITAMQAGNENYTDAQPVPQDLKIFQQEMIYMPAIADKYLSDADFDPKAISNVSDFPITYTSSNPAVAVIINNMVHIVGLGKTTISASQQGDDLHITAIPQNEEFTVLPSLVFGPLGAKIVCDIDFDPGATSVNPITYTSSNTAVAIINGGKIHLTGSGSTTITALSNGESLQQSLTVNTIPAPGLRIGSGIPIPDCAGVSTVSFTAFPTGEGPNPTYQWRVNGVAAGSSSTTYATANLANGDLVTCTITRTDVCPYPVSVTSNTLQTVGITSQLPISVAINASANNVYAGTPITFTATPFSTAAVLTYKWKVNRIDAGSNKAELTSSTFRNGDVVTCTITVDSYCTLPATSDPITLSILQPPSITIANTFTPNGDGSNDTWQIPDLSFYPNCFVQIFNRYGSEVMRSTGYSKAWDGTYKGKNLPAGTYYYIIDTRDGQPKTSGNVTLLR